MLLFTAFEAFEVRTTHLQTKNPRWEVGLGGERWWEVGGWEVGGGRKWEVGVRWEAPTPTTHHPQHWEVGGWEVGDRRATVRGKFDSIDSIAEPI